MAVQTDLDDRLERAGPDAGKRYLCKYPALVRDSFDPEERGRIRVYCPEVMGDVDSEDTWLHWAEANAPLAGHDQGLMMVPPDPSWERRDAGAGNSPFNETRVWIEFRDGDVRRPIYSLGGSWLGESDLPHSSPKLADSNTGGDESTAGPNRTSSTIRQDIADRETGETEDGPEVREVQPGTSAQYPYNYVWKLPAGHIVEFDNTPGGERIRLYHAAGTSWEINESGTHVTKITGKESKFVSNDQQQVVKGAATTIVEGLSHHQYNKSSNWIFGDDVVQIVKKSMKSFVTGGWNIETGGQYRVRAGNMEFESIGIFRIISAAAVNIGTDDFALTTQTLEASSLTSKYQATKRMHVKGFLETEVQGLLGVEITAIAPATEKLYASTAINATWVAATTTLATALSTASLPSPPGGPNSLFFPATQTTISIPGLVTWMTAVVAAIGALANSFNTNTCIHKASIT